MTTPHREINLGKTVTKRKTASSVTQPGKELDQGERDGEKTLTPTRPESTRIKTKLENHPGGEWAERKKSDQRLISGQPKRTTLEEKIPFTPKEKDLLEKKTHPKTKKKNKQQDRPNDSTAHGRKRYLSSRRQHEDEGIGPYVGGGFMRWN